MAVADDIYDFEKGLGQGSMGAVAAIRKKTTGKLHVLKTIQMNRVSEEFRLEVRERESAVLPIAMHTTESSLKTVHSCAVPLAFLEFTTVRSPPSSLSFSSLLKAEKRDPAADEAGSPRHHQTTRTVSRRRMLSVFVFVRNATGHCENNSGVPFFIRVEPHSNKSHRPPLVFFVCCLVF
jgi:hypothetical protein